MIDGRILIKGPGILFLRYTILWWNCSGKWLHDNIPEARGPKVSISLDMYPYAGGSRAAHTLLHGRIFILAHPMHMNCIFERFHKGPSDLIDHLNKKFASRRVMYTSFLYEFPNQCACNSRKSRMKISESLI